MQEKPASLCNNVKEKTTNQSQTTLEMFIDLLKNRKGTYTRKYSQMDRRVIKRKNLK